MTCLPPCQGCVEVHEQLETWRQASGWGDLHAEEVDSSKRAAHHMRCDECGRMVVLGREITPAPEPQPERKTMDHDTVAAFLIELRRQWLEGIDCNKLAKIFYHRPRAARVIDLLIQRFMVTGAWDWQIKLFKWLGMRVSYHADRWTEQGEQGEQAAEKFGGQLIEEATEAWNTELPAPPKPTENYVVRSDSGRPMFLVDLTECDSVEWVSWTRRREAIQARDREVNKSIREANNLLTNTNDRENLVTRSTSAQSRKCITDT